MKALITALVIAIFSSTSFAWSANSPTSKEYRFKYAMKGDTLEISRTGQSYEDAFQDAAQQCFNYYKGTKKVSESRGLDIIDVCANPRS